jgi:hypothetical protein
LESNVMRWVIGLVLATFVGGVITHIFLSRLRKNIAPTQASLDRPRVPAWITGIVERTFFFVLVAFNISGVPTAMVGWLAVKLAANWNRRPGPKEEEPNAKALAVSAALAGVVSMTFALLGGLVSTGQIPYKSPYVVGAVSSGATADASALADELRIFKNLSNEGVITPQEYEHLKKELLGF